MSEENIGTRKGDYEILGILGAGGMGKVYKVRNVISDRVEAMKVLLPNLTDQKDLADRFLREIKVLASLDHPNIAALRTALMIDNQLVMIMEYIEGTTLGARVEQGPIPLGDTLNYMQQVLSALSYAHKQQVIHRDIKPANMMLTPEGVIKLMDFGIARSGPDMGLTVTGTTLGSLSYMSPEQVKSAPVDARSDLYSLGVSLYEMVTGQRPFQADSHFSILQAHLRELPKPPIELMPDLPEAVSQLILKTMEKDPAQRFQSADDFLEAVQLVAAGQAASGTAAQSSSSSLAAGRREPTVLLNEVGDSRDSSLSPQELQAAQMAARQNDKRYRGLYIGLGALVVVLVLVAAGFSAPNWLKTRAKSTAAVPSKESTPKTAASDTTSLQPVEPAPASPAVTEMSPSAPAAATVEPAQPASSPAKEGAASPAISKPKKNLASKRSQASSTADQQSAVSSASSQPSGPDPEQLAEAERDSDLLASRETAIDASLDTLQRQQNAQGLQLRGDIVAAQARLRTYLGKAQAALQAQDLKNARKYLDLAAPEAEKIEKFLGR